MTAGKTVAVALGFRAERGSAVTVGVAFDKRGPRVVLSTFLATAADGDRLAREPYHVAAELAQGAKGKVPARAVSAVAEGHKRQNALAAKGLGDIIGQLKGDRFEPVVAALLVNRAGWITDLLEYSLFAPEHPAVAEGLAVRDALRSAFSSAGLDVMEMDEKSLAEVAAKDLRLSPAALDSRLKLLGADAGKPWRKEQKLACLSAWLAAARRARNA